MNPDTITLKAGSIYPVRVAGKFLTVTACTSSFKIALDDDDRATATAGAQFSKDGGFSKITFIETSGADNAVSYIISDSPSPARAIAVVSNQATFVGPNSGLQDFGTSGTVGGGGFKNYDGVDSANRHRKAIIVSNSGNTGSGSSNANLVIQVHDPGGPADGAIIGIVPPGGAPVTIDTDENLRVASLNATLSGQPGHLFGAVCEIFFTTPLQQDA